MSMPTVYVEIFVEPSDEDDPKPSLRIVHSRKADEVEAEARERALQRRLRRSRRRERALRASRGPSRSPLALW